jgi:hypothetical protein
MLTLTSEKLQGGDITKKFIPKQYANAFPSLSEARQWRPKLTIIEQPPDWFGVGVGRRQGDPVHELRRISKSSIIIWLLLLF